MNELHSRAAALLQGPCCISRDEGSPTVAILIGRYRDGETWDDPQLRQQLSRSIRYARMQATGPVGATGPERDAQRFYKQAAGILEEIQAEVFAGRV